MSIQLLCCKKKVLCGELWILKDIKGFTQRKIYIGTCPYCKDDIAVLFEKRISDNKVFKNELKGIEAVKTIYREKKRKLIALPDIKTDSLFGWVYGVNVQIKDKSGNITQLRQYSSDFKGNKKLVKTKYTDNGTT